MTVWVLADTAAGHANQALGVAEALGQVFEVKPVVYTHFAGLPNLIRGASRIGVATETRRQLQPPWPRLVIAAGRRTAPLARWIKRRSAGQTKIVQIMHPGPGALQFDLIALPLHDAHADAPNQIRITGAPHRLTQEKLEAAARDWQPLLAHLPRPYLAVLVGGATHKRSFDDATAARLGDEVEALRQRSGGSLLVTGSRRTPHHAWAALTARLSPPNALFDGHGTDNPYLGYLALADAIVVTGDSVSMACEACFSGAPVHIFAPPGFVGAKHARLHKDLYEKAYACPLGEQPHSRPPTPLNAAGDIAAEINRRFFF
ncbi:MAG: mitochondrial fission ELM1 family protein [Rhodospirillales bacterium]|nr:mitochondrial fission ELM1 family protein [Rhodospirillales bacterium]